ncbi:MAG: DUF368 domain-containing protein [Agarilytica sp.]
MSSRTSRDYAMLVAKGLAMGAADVVPGVSGGTIAFITGIYNELLHSLKNCGPEALFILFKQGPAAFWQHINGSFLIAVFGGILVSIKTFASIISFCLDNYPLLVWGFFSGLIAASMVLLAKQQNHWAWQQWALGALGALVVYGVSVAKPAQLPGDWWVLFGGGFIAICAMILPGISGSFLLLLMGLYSVFLEAIKNLDLLALGSFGLGCVCGLMVFSRFLSWLLDNFFKSTISVLMGFLLGSLNVTWPWKATLEFTVDRHGEQIPLVQSNVLPWSYQEASGLDPQLLYVILFTFFGVALVLLTEFVATRMVRPASD